MPLLTPEELKHPSLPIGNTIIWIELSHFLKLHDLRMVTTLFWSLHCLIFFLQGTYSETNDPLSPKFSYDPPLYAKIIRISTTHRPVNFTIEVCGKNQKFFRLVKMLL